MAHPMMVPAAAISLAGAALGICFGRGAIAEIKPFYFSPPPVSHFYADLVPAGYHPAQVNPAPAAEFWTNDVGFTGRGPCYDCGNQIDPAFLRPPALEPEPVSAPPPEFDSAMDDPPTAPEIERYANFPVTAEEARSRTAMAEVEPAIANGDVEGQEEGPVGM